MKTKLLLFLFLAANIAFGQKPVLNIYLNNQLSNTLCPVLADVKLAGHYVSILDSECNLIRLPASTEEKKIESIRFIVASDTIEFSIEKLFAGTKKTNDITAQVKSIFNSLNTWELYINSYSYFNSNSNGNTTGGKTRVYKEYKVYALKTLSRKSYITKS